MALSPRVPARMRAALCSWEVGRAGSGFGVKVGGLGQVVEELPPELVKAAARQGLDLEVEVLSPCFGHYDRSKLTKVPGRLPAVIEGHPFEFEAYERVFHETVELPGGPQEVGFRHVYFWDPGQLHWTHAGAVYPSDPRVGLKLYSAVAQAMAAWIRKGDFQTVHLHDYHVGLVPFFLGDDLLARRPVHLTIHNASYQGVTFLEGGGYATLDRAGLPGEALFHKYFDFFDNVNLLKAAMLKVHETGGRVTTVSGDLAATWGYAAELAEGQAAVAERARRITGRPAAEVFVPNRHLDLFEQLPVAGITNGLAERNRAGRMPELKAGFLAERLKALRERQGPGARLFRDDEVQSEMLARDHSFDGRRLKVKVELKRLLYREVFGHPIWGYPAVFGVVGRLVDQKNLGLVADIADRVLAYDPMARFVVLASAAAGDPYGAAMEAKFRDLAARQPGRVWFSGAFDPCLSRLIFAGSDFALVPSRFEPCGLVDYEAALLGAVPICRATGGLVKVRHCGYLYEWLDVGDYGGEAEAFLAKVKEALAVFRDDYPGHQALVRRALATDAAWDASAADYVRLYRYGRLAKMWHASGRTDPEAFAAGLGRDRRLFSAFLAPGKGAYGHPADLELRAALDRRA
ncbi:MAG: glycogen/starch synthase [Elusimicrobia bacterium]|nr:glycogen/starch synthase [Elusimicrobiota bacterium]